LLSAAELDRLRVVLVDARNPLNIGAAARAISNFGFSRLRVVNPYEVAFRKARSAVGAAEVLAAAQQCKTVAEAVADCALVIGTTAVRHRDLHHPLRQLDDHAGSLIHQQLQSENVALLFGSERVGLSNEDLSYCHWLIRIPTREHHISMNLGQAVAVCLYELIRASPATLESQVTKPANAEEVERFTEILIEVLQLSGYVKRGSGISTKNNIRRAVRRLNLAASDTDLWLGMLRQIRWKLGSDE
jgi:TrmH family RNA methyltransferase